MPAATEPTILTYGNLTVLTGPILCGKTREAWRMAQRHEKNVFVMLGKVNDIDAPWRDLGIYVSEPRIFRPKSGNSFPNTSIDLHYAVRTLLDLAHAGDMVILEDAWTTFSPMGCGMDETMDTRHHLAEALDRGVHVVLTLSHHDDLWPGLHPSAHPDLARAQDEAQGIMAS